MNFYAESFVQQAQASLAQGVLTGLAANRVAFVARGDVAAAAAGILIGDGHAGAIYNAIDIAAIYEKGKQIESLPLRQFLVIWTVASP